MVFAALSAREEIARSGVAAGGSLETTPASVLKKVWLACELLALFCAAPVGMHYIIRHEKIPIFVALLPVLVFALVMLLWDRTFLMRRELARGFSWKQALSIFLLLALGGGAATYWVMTVHPSWFLEFPRERPERFRQIMLLYPIFSVAAQELVYRTFYFHRYGVLFGKQAWLAVLVNGGLFGFAHIVVGSQFAIIATFFGGLLLALRYLGTRSFWAVFIEHTLWGWLIFTIGLGKFFFTGVSNLR